jgi:hypothetical protein
MEELMRDKTCCNTPDRSIQPYSLFVLTYEGKGLFTATRDPKVRIYIDLYVVSWQLQNEHLILHVHTYRDYV